MAPASAPSPRQGGKALLVLREGGINGIYYQGGGLTRYGTRIDDFDFLLKSVAKLFPPAVESSFDTGTRGFGDDTTLDRALVKKYQPDTFVVVTLECRIQSRTRLLLLNRNWFQAEARIDFLAPDTLAVIDSRTVQSDFFEGKGTSQSFPREVKDQLAQRVASQLTVLPPGVR